MNQDLVRIQAETDPRNQACIRVLEKNGFTLECIKKQSFYCRGTWRDSALYRLLREEWTGPHTNGRIYCARMTDVLDLSGYNDSRYAPACC